MSISNEKVDVQTSPLILRGTGKSEKQFKVDNVVHHEGSIFVRGWCTADLLLELRSRGVSLSTHRVDVERPDVAAHFGLSDGSKCGFVLVAPLAADEEVEIVWIDRECGIEGSSRSLEYACADSAALIPTNSLNALQVESKPNRSLASTNAVAESIRFTPLKETRMPAKEAVIVGAAQGLDADALRNTNADIFALNGAYFHLDSQGVKPFALVTGDRRFLLRHGLRNLSSVRKIITFDYALDISDHQYLSASTIVEVFPCKGRDGYSANQKAGFFHGCSSFFLAIQYLTSVGYRRISAIGVKFPPPEMYFRLSGSGGHPEFVYGIQLNNLNGLKGFLMRHGVALSCRDVNSNLSLFL